MAFDTIRNKRLETMKLNLPPEIKEKVLAVETAGRSNLMDKYNISWLEPNNIAGADKQGEKAAAKKKMEFEGYLCVYDRNAKNQDGTGYMAEFGCVSGNNERVDDIPQNLLDYYNLADETNTIIKLLYAPERVKNCFNKEKYKSNMENALKNRNNYISELIETSQVGLNGNNPQPKIATDSLNRMRKEIIIKEGGKIKNWHTKRLGIWALLSAIVFSVLALWMANLSTGDAMAGEWLGQALKGNAASAYLFAFAGAAIGTWVAFLIRRRNLEFINLVLMDDDRLSCLGRVMFSCAVSFLFMLFLVSGIFSFSIGTIDFGEIKNIDNVDLQMVVGAIAGLTGNSLADKIFSTAEGIADGEEE
ncbi:MAG: hypothetical protein JXN65_01900 [Clostridia bacterium]|nr:hypothetical protein [Clostridia bacterium]